MSIVYSRPLQTAPIPMNRLELWPCPFYRLLGSPLCGFWVFLCSKTSIHLIKPLQETRLPRPNTIQKPPQPLVAMTSARAGASPSGSPSLTCREPSHGAVQQSGLCVLLVRTCRTVQTMTRMPHWERCEHAAACSFGRSAIELVSRLIPRSVDVETLTLGK